MKRVLNDDFTWLGSPAILWLNFTEMKFYVEALLSNLGVVKWDIRETKHPSFLPGRAAAIHCKREKVGVLGKARFIQRSSTTSRSKIQPALLKSTLKNSVRKWFRLRRSCCF